MSIEKIIICGVEALFQSLAATIIIFKQVGNKSVIDKIKFSILMYAYFIICFIFIPNQLRFISFIIVASLLIFLILKVNDRKLLIYSFNTELIVTICEIFISIILVLCGLNSEDIVNNYFYNLIANILISIFAIAITYLKSVGNIMDVIITLFSKNRRMSNYLCIFLFILYLILSKNGLEFILRSNYYVNILFIIAVILVIVIIIKNEFKYDHLNEQNKQMLNYVTKYEKIITEQGKANHEFKNQLMVIRGYAQMNSPKLIEYLDSIVEDANKTHSSYLISQLNKFPDGGIKGLLYYKLSIMDDENVKYEIDVEDGVKKKLNTLVISEYKNITKILGVLLDNAIDASKHTKNKKIIISVTKEKSIVTFGIYNTYKGKIDLSKIGTGHTTKGQGHGYGLRLVKDIVEENKMFSISNCLEDKYYVSKLSIKTTKRKK